MKEIFIKYNPYQLVTEITIDGQKLKKNSKLNFEDMTSSGMGRKSA